MKLPLLSGHGACRDDTQLTRLEIYTRTREHLAVAVDDHPIVERGMQVADVPAQLLIGIAVHDRASLFSALVPGS